MITGFNTDVEYEGVTYHVQTEDKGVKTPLILSLVYDRGTILASKRSPYDDLLEGEFDENVLVERLHKQHKLICAAVMAGRIEDLKRMTNDAAFRKNAFAENGSSLFQEKRSASAQEELIVKRESPIKETQKIEVQKTKSLKYLKVPHAATKNGFYGKSRGLNKSDYQRAIKPISKPEFLGKEQPSQKLAEKIDKVKGETLETTLAEEAFQSINPLKIQTLKIDQAKPTGAIPKPKHELVWNLPSKPEVAEGVVMKAFEIIEEEPVVEAVQILTQSDKIPKSPQQTDKLQVDILAETAFRGGERKTISVFVHRGIHENGIDGAQIMVKVLGSTFRPLIFHAKTDGNGIAVVHMQLPHFRAGRAAILVRAMSGGEEAELRRVISHN